MRPGEALYLNFARTALSPNKLASVGISVSRYSLQCAGTGAVHNLSIKVATILSVSTRMTNYINTSNLSAVGLARETSDRERI